MRMPQQIRRQISAVRTQPLLTTASSAFRDQQLLKTPFSLSERGVYESPTGNLAAKESGSNLV